MTAGVGTWALARRGNGWLTVGPDFARIAPATRPLLLASAGAAVGLGVALLHDKVLGSDDVDFTKRNGSRLRQDLDAKRQEVERGNVEHEEAARSRLMSEEFGAPGTVGEGRFLQAGTVDEVTDALMTAYDVDEDGIFPHARRIVGSNEFDIDRLMEHVSGGQKIHRELLRTFISEEVDIGESPGVVTREELVAWQLGPYGERRTGPDNRAESERGS